MKEREYSRIIHITLVASVRASNKREADRLIDRAAFGTLVGDTLDESGSFVERLMVEKGRERVEYRGVQFSYEASQQEPAHACSHDDMGKWLAWCSDHRCAQMRPFDPKALAAAKIKYDPPRAGEETPGRKK